MAAKKRPLPSASRPKKASAQPASSKTQAERIYAVVRAIPRGRVATYGQLALLAGIHAGHRIAARAMQQCPAGLPWFRVLAKKDARRARIAVLDPEHAALQRKSLSEEGVQFDSSGHVALQRFGWLPSEVARKKRAK